MIEEFNILEFFGGALAFGEDELKFADEEGILNHEDDHGVIEGSAEPILDLDDLDFLRLLKDLQIIINC